MLTNVRSETSNPTLTRRFFHFELFCFGSTFHNTCSLAGGQIYTERSILVSCEKGRKGCKAYVFDALVNWIFITVHLNPFSHIYTKWMLETVTGCAGDLVVYGICWWLFLFTDSRGYRTIKAYHEVELVVCGHGISACMSRCLYLAVGCSWLFSKLGRYLPWSLTQDFSGFSVNVLRWVSNCSKFFWWTVELVEVKCHVNAQRHYQHLKLQGHTHLYEDDSLFTQNCRRICKHTGPIICQKTIWTDTKMCRRWYSWNL